MDNRLADLTAETGSAAAGLVWFVLFRWASAKDGTVKWATITRLANATGLDRRTVATALRALGDIGAVETEGERRRGRGAVPVLKIPHVPAEAEMSNG